MLGPIPSHISLALEPTQRARDGAPGGQQPSCLPSSEGQPSAGSAAIPTASKGLSLGSLCRTETSGQSHSAGGGPSHTEPTIIVTPFTPHRADVNLDMRCELELTLLPVVRGQGNFGRVVEGLYGGRRVAVKLVRDVNEWCGAPQPGTARHGFVQEIEVLGRCDHPNIVRLLAACMTPPRLCLVMELMECSLERLMYREFEPGPGAGLAAAAAAPAAGLEQGPSESGLAAGDGAGPGPHGAGASGEMPRLLPLPHVLHIGVEVARGLAYLHPT
ncbi:putative serine/threonine-protein kinase [Tetrabaena socialis]|uniref:Putative serine/threonine-protein kinase n=1 Tax=Tetrabaena socialis TaxID=47790 RepID=A0A2J7ZNK4_9CHLO|nr:putative serine/threonine-protein kinase [Tetrabaena socialis]|eukprot:PNH01852.1 putative serine/threonine-protein kinase [Tetrabaena socialis]